MPQRSEQHHTITVRAGISPLDTEVLLDGVPLKGVAALTFEARGGQPNRVSLKMCANVDLQAAVRDAADPLVSRTFESDRVLPGEVPMATCQPSKT